MPDQPSSIELDVPAGEVEAAVVRVCADWGVPREAVDVVPVATAEPAGSAGEDAGSAPEPRLHVLVRRRDPMLDGARRILAELLQRMGIRADIVALWGTGDPVTGVSPIVLDVRGDDLGMLIGRRGETLAALQYITRLIVAKELGEGLELVVDVQGHKRRREEQLRRMARRVAEQAALRNRTMTLEPMPAYERRIVHLELRDHPGVRTESVGEGLHRKVTIIPK